MLSSSSNKTYDCINKTCTWENDCENIDWGYLSKNDGNCSACIDMCDKDLFCQAVECGHGYCSWWKNDKCIDPYDPSSIIQTCIRKSDVKGTIAYAHLVCISFYNNIN